MVDEGLARWKNLVAIELPAANRALQDAGLAALKTD